MNTILIISENGYLIEYIFDAKLLKLSIKINDWKFD